jgi:hypothetical protein
MNTRCSYCRDYLPMRRKYIFFGPMVYDCSRKGPFDEYYCSGRCEVAGSDELDNMEDKEYHDRIHAWWLAAPSLSRKEYIAACKQRGVKP